MKTLQEEIKIAQSNKLTFEQFEDNYGWADWMADFCEDPTFPTGKEFNAISDYLLEKWVQIATDIEIE